MWAIASLLTYSVGTAWVLPSVMANQGYPRARGLSGVTGGPHMTHAMRQGILSFMSHILSVIVIEAHSVPR